MKYLLESSKGQIIASNLNDNCMECKNNCTDGVSSVFKCKLDHRKRRLGLSHLGEGNSVFLCSQNKDDIRSKRLFKNKLAIYQNLFGELADIRNNITEEINQRTKRLVHNVTSLNAHNIQEIYAFVPQELLAKEFKNQVRHIEKHLEQERREAAFLFLRIAKNNIAMKTEFSVFKKLYETSPHLSSRHHQIRKVILNVFHIFFQDFTDHEVRVDIDECSLRVEIDYESFHVALYHLIENAAKYILPHSHLKLHFQKIGDQLDVIFDMMSVKIADDEVDSICDEGFSGALVSKLHLAGHGIGMFHTKKILTLNKAELFIKHDVDPDKRKDCKGIPYENNQFIIRLKLAK